MRLSSSGVRHAILAAILLLTARPLSVAAQAHDHALAETGRGACLDSIPPSAFTRVVIYGYVEFVGTVSQALRTSAELLLQDVSTLLPTVLGDAAGVLPAGEPNVTWRGLAAPLRVTVWRNGRISHTLPAGRADTAAAALLARALDLVIPNEVFLWGADSLRDSVSFRFELSWPSIDKKGRVTPPRFTTNAVPLFSVSHPWELTAAPKPGNKGPRYPNAARSAGYGGLVNMQFIIDTMGRAVPSSMRALWPDTLPQLEGEKRMHYDAFVDEVRRVLPAMEFYPAEIAGCKTAQLVQMPFQFSLSP